ncbi:macro domain-containing protein [Butyrivibrio sp. JL13D10]|uniref:macro domain-containing protein n=1 Tax=Butyrivibrio sp. JL13D10 TaxID=3236815 RepID=UPI0038B4D952
MIHVIQGDITKVTGFDAIVNPANNSLLGGGGLDGLIHRAAGPQLKTECRRLNGCETGDSKLTLGYNLPCKYVIHSVGPIWMGGMAGEEELLTSCYTSAMRIALSNNIRKIAFSSISTGEYGYPLDKAAKVAISIVSSFIAENPDSFDDICWVVADDLAFMAYSEEIKNAVPTKEEKKEKPAKKSKGKSKAGKSTDSASTSSDDKNAKALDLDDENNTNDVVPPVFPKAPYNKYHLDWLIDEVGNGSVHTYVCFYLAEKNNDYCELSLWYKGEPIFINGRRYYTALQYIMAEKALLFNDFISYKKIINESDPAICQKLGDSISNYDDNIWKNSYREILYNANVGKFLSDKAFADALMSTEKAILINATPDDDILGAGMDKEELLSDSGMLKVPPQNWHKSDSDFQAKNELGFVLMSVRDAFC